MQQPATKENPPTSAHSHVAAPESGARYTTGELATACGVSVRTVQYYDGRGLLHPAERTGGGRRLYDEDDRTRLQAICTLKAMGLSLDAIRGILADPEDTAAVTCLLAEQERMLAAKRDDAGRMLDAVRALSASVSSGKPLSRTPDLDSEVEMSKREIEARRYRKNQRKLAAKVTMSMVFLVAANALAHIVSGALPEESDAQIALFIGQVITNILVLLYVLEAGRTRWIPTRYLCLRCGKSFKATYAAFLAGRSKKDPRGRVLHLACPHCGERSWCVENNLEEEPAHMTA